MDDDQNSNSFMNDVKFDKFQGREEEDVVDQKILYMICIIIMANQLNHFMQHYLCGVNRFFQGEHGLTMLIGIGGGFLAQQYYTEKDIKDFLFS